MSGAAASSASRLEVETPDHVVLRYDLAGAGNRGFAALLDAVIVAFFVSGLVIAWSIWALPRAGQLTGYFGLAVVLLGWSYFVLLEWLWNGQTIGKRVFGLRVIARDGTPASFFAVLVRNLVRIVDFLPSAYGVGLVAIVLGPRSQRLGDLAAATYVVRAPHPRTDWTSLRTVERGTGRAGEAHAARAQVRLAGISGEAQRLVREFVAREETLAPRERATLARSIADHLRSRVPELDEADDVALIRSVARALRASGEA